MKSICYLLISYTSNLKKIIFVGFLLITIVSGQENIENPDSALTIRLSEIQGTPISLEQAIQLVNEKSTEMRQAKAVLMAAKAVYKRELGVFDPELFARWEYSDNKTPTASFFSGANVLHTRQALGQAGIRMSLPFGTEIEASLNTTRLQTNSSFASLNPQYNASASLTLRQPLLAGFNASARKHLSSAEKSLEAAQKRFDQIVLDLSAQVERNYWDLYAAERDFAVQQLVRDQAMALLEETRIRAKAGLVGPSQVANAKVFLTQQALILYDNEEKLDKMSDQFASFIGKRPEKGMKRFIMSDQPPQNFSSEEVEDIVAHSINNNYHILAAKNDVENATILAKAAGWEALPSLDLIGSIGGNGLSGKGQDIVFSGQTFPGPASSNINEALNQSINRDYPNWSVGVEISYPIGSRTGNGDHDFARAQVMVAEQQYIAAERQLEEDIRSSHRELENGIQRLQIVRDQVEAAKEQVRIGLIEYRNGRSTAFELVRLAADFAQSQQRYSQELVRNAKAAATLKQLTSGGYPTHKTN
jgi:outer membrane protein